MTTSWTEARESEETEAQAAWFLTREYLIGAGVATVVAAPLALVVAPHPWNSIGIGYAVGYSLFLLWTTGPLLFICHDAILVARGHEPRMLRRMVTAYVLDPDSKPIPFLRALSWYANPFANLTVSLVVSGLRVNPQGFINAWNEAVSAAGQYTTVDRSRPAEPTTAITRPLIRCVDRELQHC